MGKVSIALRGWRFEEDEVFAPDGRLKPLEEMPDDAAGRLTRLSTLVGSPCDACWLIHGDEDLEQCAVAEVVYGEPLSEVVLCADHEDDFVYWFREAGGSRHRGEPEIQDAFHEWFADGGRAPDGYEGVEHVDTDPQALPDLPDERSGALDMHLPDERKERIDLKAMEVKRGSEADPGRAREVDVDPADDEATTGDASGDGAPGNDAPADEASDVDATVDDASGEDDEDDGDESAPIDESDLSDADVDLSRDYPG